MGELLEALKGIDLPNAAHKVVIEADAIYSKRAENASYVAHLESKVKDLQSEIDNLRKQKGISGIRDNLVFSEVMGTYVEAGTGLHYCTKCLAGEKRQPLQKDKYGWRCNVCGAKFRNPNAPIPQVQRDYDPFNP